VLRRRIVYNVVYVLCGGFGWIFMCMFLTMCPIRKFTVCFVMNFVQVLTTSGRLGIGTTVYYWPVTAK